MPDNEISLKRLTANPVVLVISAVVVLVILIVPIYWLATHHLLTAVALTGFFAIIFFGLAQSKILDPSKQRWAAPTVIIVLLATFLFGVYGEATGSFYVTPLTETQQTVPPMLANVPTVISANITAIMVMALLVVVIIGLTVRKS